MKKIKKDTKIFILIWVVILLSIGIMFLTMYKSSNKNTKINLLNNNEFKTIISGDTTNNNVLIELTPHKQKNGEMIFDINLNTHSVDLSNVDLKKVTKLEINGKTYNPISAPILEGHHNSGELIFKIGNIDSSKFKITIIGISKINLREFNW